MRTCLSIFFFCFFFVNSLNFSQDVSKSSSLIRFLENNQTHTLHLLEKFDGETPYLLKKSDSYLQDLFRVSKIPSTEEFLQEREEFKKIFGDYEDFSMEIHTYIEIPDREKIRIVPKVHKYLPYGIPTRLFLWVYSKNYLGKLSVNLSHPIYGKQKIELGDLGFFGWKKIEAKVPILKTPRLNILRKNLFELEEIIIEFSKKQPKAVVHLYLNHLLVLIEKPTPNYPGIEIEDGWKLKN